MHSRYRTLKDGTKKRDRYLKSRCKTCSSKIVRLWRLKNDFGMTEAQQKQMITKQKNKCPICGDLLNDNYHTDHDHKTGRVRGILCSYCNQGLGQFKDNVESLKNAIEYLRL